MTPTAFAAAALDLLPYEPPVAKRGPRYGSCPDCWLCGGLTHGVGWPQALAIAPTFAPVTVAARPDSDAVCQPCAAFTRAETFQALVARRSLSLKVWTQAGWHSYSHFVREDGHYEAPTPSRLRDILTDPPEGPWLLAINPTGQKHTIFRSAVARSRDIFPVQVDEERLWVSRERLLDALAAFEALTAMGCGKDGVETGRYHPADLARVTVGIWRPAEERMAGWRARNPALIALVRIIAKARTKETT